MSVGHSGAEQDRSDLRDYIAADNPQAAVRMDDLFNLAVARLARFPLSGKPGTVRGTRELIPHESYRLVYDVAIWILAAVHTVR